MTTLRLSVVFSLGQPGKYGLLRGKLLFASATAIAVTLACVGHAQAQDSDGLTPAEISAVKAAEQQRVAVIRGVYGAVVAIYGNDRGGGGSGVLLDKAGFVLTNHHVVAGAGVDGWGGLADGKLYRWKLIGTDPGGDVAIIQLQGRDDFPTAPLADSEMVKVGDWAMAMGNPFVLAEDQRPTVTLGIVSGVHRFQEGSGMNQLVYGNCIQVDSSINPGNSGGPLFSLRGQIIGINGRGSFEERGRVNVGLGYAISSNQVRHFIPELLATKIAQHGTLDAVFGNREGKVICHTVNLDSPIAQAGLQLGDKLIGFEGKPVVSANQFTNDLSMFPAGWPVEVTWERDGQPTTAWVRLASLPYEPIVKQQPMEAPPEEKPAEGKPDEEKPEPAKEEKPEAPKSEQPGEEKPKEEKPAQPEGSEKPTPEQPKEEKPPAEKPDPNQPPMPMPLPTEKIVPQRPALALGDAGKIRDKALNQSITSGITTKWRAACGFDKQDAALIGLRMESQLIRDGQNVGSQQITIARDNRVRVDVELDGKKHSLGSDGKTFWLLTPDKPAQTVSQARALRDTHFSQAMALAVLLTEKPLASLGDLVLDGADKGRGRLCYRLSITDSESEQFFAWLSVCDDSFQPQVQLQKTGVGIQDDEPIYSVTYDQWKAADGVLVPWKRTLVKGLAEVPELSCETQSCSALAEIQEAAFQLPAQ